MWMHKERSQQNLPRPRSRPPAASFVLRLFGCLYEIRESELGGRKDIFGIWYSFVYFSQYFVINVYTSVSYSEMAPPLGGGNVG